MDAFHEHIPHAARSRSWNILIFVNTSIIAGVYQRGDLLRVADLTHELDLCFVFDRPDDDKQWQPALLPRVTTARHSLTILDHQDKQPLPTPTPGEDIGYTYIFHSSQCTRRDTHSLEEPCIQHVGKPQPRHEPRYHAIGKQSQDERLAMVPLRKVGNSKRRSIPSSSSAASWAATSPPPAKMMNLDEPIPVSVVSAERARTLIEAFRDSVFYSCRTCVFSGKSFFLGYLAGPGIEAAHIVPPVHWNTYPVGEDGSIASVDKPDQLESAWKCTWVSENGLSMQSHLHECFNARLISIHPETHLIRAFVNYDVINDFHGQKAKIPRRIDQRALQHHWDMCCLENTPGGVFRFLATLIKNPVRAGELSNKDGNPVSTNKSDTEGSNEEECSPSRPWERRRLWWFGRRIIDDPNTARQLVEAGWRLEEINDEEEHGRGRSPGKRRCVATEEDAEDDGGNRDGVHGTKKQRLE
ncbi:hypothetical protein VP1G_04971 [Cytospora mali]|uniref:HNH nuclease domain-containing protein n=1 Tax=Cytospora mali TaxID=578113 RepID=A0A194V139_CYTMA|nr:hypothetical protein VP1G_04971 [Valsa mali var. pyri (nom. inval.)]